jgi:Tfp pilus assembly protein PilV
MIVHRGGNGRRHTQGFLLMEVMAAVFLFGVALTVAVQLMAWVGAEQRSAARRRWATQEAQNVLERLTAAPFAALTPGGIASLNLGERAERTLPAGRMDVQVNEQTGPPASKRLTVAIRWKDRAGRDVPPVRLAAWVYPEEPTR